jgi:hypothetical protein
MKHSDLKLDTVYADHDGLPLVVVSLDKYAKPGRGYGARTIRPRSEHDKSFGVVVVRLSYGRRGNPVEDLVGEAARLRREFPATEGTKDGFEVSVQNLGTIIREWDDHLVVVQAEAERRRQAAEAKARVQAIRTERLAHIRALLPEGIEVSGDSSRSWVSISHRDLISILEARA